ncbi:MAG TPA: peptidylprolyl isomerase [Bacteroidales bacterium]|nr:peptidylprolyl isomerase [Bacteroidales bacterium]
MIFRRFSFITAVLICLTSTSVTGQERTVLLTVNGHDVSVDEFEWLYKKNNSGITSSSIDEYMDLYINFRLKVEAAREAGIDKTDAFKKELGGYRRQLARSYLTDQGVKEELLRSAYERSKTEINAYHILVRCPQDAKPDDTLAAYSKAMDIRERIRMGEPFESVARGASDDPFVTMNGGNLGYFSVFQTPIAFENTAYSMSVGALSKPVRTADGYHIIKIQDRRRASGRIKVAHIMQATPVGAGVEKNARAKQVIDSLYNLLVNEGADFAQLAKDNSDDLGSASNEGELPWFGPGEMVHEFSESSLRLMRDGDISEPVKTVYGWHIIKRIDKQLPRSYDEARNLLESKLNQSYLATQSRKSFAAKLKKEYDFRLNDPNLKWFYPVADSAFRSGGYINGISDVPDRILYSFADVKCSMKDFTDYIRKKGSNVTARDSVIFINSLLEMRSYDDLLAYEDSMLEVKYPEFRYLVNEFHDGIMLFEISDSLLWSRSVTDSSGLRAYYETVKGDFLKEPWVEARIFTIVAAAGKKKTKELTKLIRNNLDKEGGEISILNAGIDKGDTLITINHIKATHGENAVTDKVKWSVGVHTLNENSGTHIAEILKVNESEYMDFEEVRGSLSVDYIEYLEKQWIRQLRDRFTVIFDESLFNNLKQKYH